MRRAVGLALLGLLVSATPVAAAPITFTLSPATGGLAWSIENEGLIVGDENTYSILLTLHVDGYPGAGEYLSALAMSVSAGSPDAMSLVAAPTGYGFALSPNVGLAGASSNCNGSNNGSACVADGSTGDGNLALTADGDYTWQFHVDPGSSGFAETTTLAFAVTAIHQGKFKGGATIVTGSAGSLRLPPPAAEQEVDLPPDGPNDLAPVPEPTSLLLLGTGLIVAANRMRRRT